MQGWELRAGTHMPSTRPLSFSQLHCFFADTAQSACSQSCTFVRCPSLSSETWGGDQVVPSLNSADVAQPPSHQLQKAARAYSPRPGSCSWACVEQTSVSPVRS